MLVGIEDNLAHSANPETCRLVGKECRDCVSNSASAIATLCPTLDATGAQQLFFRMYRSHDCSGMARAFVREYLSAVEPEPIEIPRIRPQYAVAACA